VDVHGELEMLGSVDEWQASSHQTLCNAEPEALFDGVFATRYRVLHGVLWKAMLRLHGTLATIKELDAFPFDDVYAPGDMEFWRLTYMNSVDAAILQLHKLVNDTGPDIHSLRSFKNEIVKGSWKNPAMKDLLVKTLDERRFDPRAEAIAKMVDRIRDNYVGHLVIDKNTGIPELEKISVNLDDLQKLFKAAHGLFGAISFGASYATLGGDLIPSTINGKRSRSCLQRVMDAVLRDSDFVNQPERRAPYWEMDKICMTRDQLRTMNDLRKRIGLPEV
jgi:hypothetical protein